MTRSGDEQRRVSGKDPRALARQLDDEQRALIGSRLVAGARSAGGWLALLEPVARADRARDAVRGLGRLFRPDDVPDRLRGCVVPWLHLLAEETRPGELVELTVDLRGAVERSKELRGAPPPSQGPRVVRVKQEVYRDPWFTGRTVLHDGSRLSFTVTDLHRHRVVTKRSASGKHKQKSKTRTKEAVTVSLGIRNDRYRPFPVPGGAASGVVVVPGPRRTTHRIRLSRLVEGDETRSGTLPSLVAAVERVYDQVQPAVDDRKGPE